MVSIGFGGAEVIQVNLPLDEVRKLLQEALEKRVLLELQVQNEHGEEETVIINPEQVKVLQNSGPAELFPEDVESNGSSIVTTGS